MLTRTHYPTGSVRPKELDKSWICAWLSCLIQLLSANSCSTQHVSGTHHLSRFQCLWCSNSSTPSACFLVPRFQLHPPPMTSFLSPATTRVWHLSRAFNVCALSVQIPAHPQHAFRSEFSAGTPSSHVIIPFPSKSQHQNCKLRSFSHTAIFTFTGMPRKTFSLFS